MEVLVKNKSCQTFAFNDFELLLKKIHPSPMVLFNLFFNRSHCLVINIFYVSHNVTNFGDSFLFEDFCWDVMGMKIHWM